ncbi:sigma-54-dependent Fis family transcriptional regulator [Ectothiorhodospiraceae bacterium WFHF3C12]|nr:sigma-54-dependent Fis family transcriptional regulator [Ectothiorhodospiraceae bacterium WFHF3C12]
MSHQAPHFGSSSPYRGGSTGRRTQLVLIEDDPTLGEALSERLSLEGLEVDWVTTAEAGYARMVSAPADLLLCDMRLPDGDGGALFRRLQQDAPQALPPTLFITAHARVEEAVDLLKCGAADYLVKPVDPQQLISRIFELCRCEACEDWRERTPLGVSPAMRELEQHLHSVIRHPDTPVLLLGETGVGKEVVARRLHELQGGEGRMVALNCAAVPEGLIEAELFGHRRGAFTGADRDRAGVFEQAAGGTLLLDEIGDMPAMMQAKLLRALQDRAVTPVGESEPVAIRARLVFATHRDLREEVTMGRFREDLYYRINVVSLRIPPLRERREDIIWLAERFLAEQERAQPSQPRRLSEEAREALLAHDWPGQVRELRHAIERACVFANGPVIGAEDLLPEQYAQVPEGSEFELQRHLGAAEREHLERALVAHDWHITRTAESLGLSRKGLWQKMRRHALRRPGDGRK